ncbi:MAG: cardiolipin synthase [Phycisphaerales bacterium]|nr:cardiolipin synthase [Phycisphaerales bacterium]
MLLIASATTSTGLHIVLPAMLVVAHITIIIALISVILLRESGTSDARLAWIVFVVLAPFFGAAAYLLFGGQRIGGIRRRRHREIHRSYSDIRRDDVQSLQAMEVDMPDHWRQVFSLAGAVTNTDVTGGHELHLIGEPKTFADEFIADIDAATDTIHLLTYIYLDDETGRVVADALIRAAHRGVTVRLLVDSVGSRNFLKSQTIKGLRDEGVQVGEMLPAHIVRVLFARVDIRNHRKIAVFDNRIGWVGSRNIASPSFAPKARFAPWVDCMARVLGPAIHDLQTLFLEDWFMATEERHEEYLNEPIKPTSGTACCQIMGTGPNFNNEALQQILQNCFYAAQHEIILTTPYFVPDSATEAALRGAALRGVRTLLIVPSRNDSHLVALASRSHYATLIKAGVEIQEFTAGLLHAKTMTIDGSLFMIGSANLDRRSLELNFEVSMLGWSEAFASTLRFLQTSYLNQCQPVDTARWLSQPALGRMKYNLAGLFSPLL